MPLLLETIAIGDELLTGKISDTNTAFVAAEFFKRGMRLAHSQTVADEPEAIQELVLERAKKADFIVCFGGLGPTSDDKTAATLADLLKSPLIQDPPSLERLHRRMAERGREVTPQNLKQVLFPKGCEVLPNSVGLAPGFQCRLGKAVLFFLPGVPIEMKPMFLNSVLPSIESSLGYELEAYRSLTWKCLGIPESELQRRMDQVEAALPPQAWLGYRTKFPENHLTLYWRSKAETDQSEFQNFSEQIQNRIADVCYTSEDKELEELVLDALGRQKLTLALVESCTGGLCAQRLTRIAGSSRTFWGGVVTYQVAAKKTLLDVQVASDEGAVSAECSKLLAANLKEKSGCQVVAAVTGYMGPGGGTPADPIGTIYTAVQGTYFSEARFQLHGNDRQANQWAASTHVLHQILLCLNKTK